MNGHSLPFQISNRGHHIQQSQTFSGHNKQHMPDVYRQYVGQNVFRSVWLDITTYTLLYYTLSNGDQHRILYFTSLKTLRGGDVIAYTANQK